MIKKELIDWIQENIDRGFKTSEIKKNLSDTGWSKDDINDTFNYVMEAKENIPGGTPRGKALGIRRWFFAAVPAIIIMTGIIIFLVTSVPSTANLSSQIQGGTNVNITQGKVVQFDLNNETHSIKVNSVTQNSVTLTIHSEPINVTLTVGEEKEVDLNGDGKPDLVIKLISITNGVPNLYIQKIIPCVEDWVCSNWSACTPSGKEIRACSDVNSCGTDSQKPIQERTCDYNYNLSGNKSVTKENGSIIINSTALINKTINITNHGKNITTTLCSGFVNRSEIGGNNLVAVTAYGNSTVDSNGRFNANVSKEGAEWIFLVDKNNDLRATSISIPPCQNNLIFDSKSTAEASIFVGMAGVSANNPEGSRNEMGIIDNLSCFKNLHSFLKNNLKNNSLNVLFNNSNYSSILEGCLMDVYNRIENNSLGDKGVSTIKATSMNKITGTVYSNFTLKIPNGAVASNTQIQVLSLASTQYDHYLGGSYIISPRNILLSQPATISITLTNAGTSMYEKSAWAIESNTQDISSLTLTLAYYNASSYKYVPIPSSYNKSTKTVSANISTLYGDGIQVMTNSSLNL